MGAKLLVISGPSGVGKGTVIERLRGLCDTMHLSVSATTRAPRPGEVDGEHYRFMSVEMFERARDRGELLEYENYGGHWYGTLRSELEVRPVTVIEADVRGGLSIREQRPDATLVFLAPPSLEELEARLRGRGTETEQQVRSRLCRAVMELSEAKAYDHVLTCGDAGTVAAAIHSMLS